MTADLVTALELGVLGGFVLSIAMGLYLWGRLRTIGGLELGLAHLVANGRRRRRFVAMVGVSFGAFVAAGLVEALSALVAFDTIADLLTPILLLAGGIGLLMIIAEALRPTSLSLEEEWRLAESAARASARATTQAPPER